MKLTKQEKLVLDLLLQGFSRKEIAKELFIAPSTVQTHTMSIYKKLDVHSVGELAQFQIKKLQEKVKELEKQISHLIPYKKRWEYLRERAFAERMGDR